MKVEPLALVYSLTHSCSY